MLGVAVWREATTHRMWAKVRQSVVTEEPPPSAWDVVDIDKRDTSGKTALLSACEKGDAAVCRLLLIQRASPDICAVDGQSPLYFACRAGSLEYKLLQHTQAIHAVCRCSWRGLRR